MGHTLKEGNIYISCGNSKLSKDVAIFSLPTIVCKHNKCWKTCYAHKTEVRFKTVERMRMRNLEATKNPKTFVESMIKLIKRSNKNIVRIHEGGEFFSKRYIESWERIINALPSIKFYTYTKTKLPIKKIRNFNVVKSILPDNDLNYGDKIYVEEKSRKFNIPICPHGYESREVTCMVHCDRCLYEPYMLFLIH